MYNTYLHFPLKGSRIAYCVCFHNKINKENMHMAHVLHSVQLKNFYNENIHILWPFYSWLLLIRCGHTLASTY